MAIRCAIFDVDGTLLDSMPMWNQLPTRFAREKGVNLPAGAHRQLNALSLEECAAYFQNLGVPGTVTRILEEIVDCSRQGYREIVGEKPHATAFLKRLKEEGLFLAVATASDLEAIMPALDRLGMTPYLDFFRTCSQVGKGKDHPDIFLECAGHFSCAPEECVVFEDSLHAIHTARKAGFVTVALRDDSDEDPSVNGGSWKLLQHASDLAIVDFGQLLR